MTFCCININFLTEIVAENRNQCVCDMQAEYPNQGIRSEKKQNKELKNKANLHIETYIGEGKKNARMLLQRNGNKKKQK